MKELSIVIPILNEADNILKLIPEINKIKKKLKIKKFEILLVDDNSKDNIVNVVNKLKKKYKYLKLIIRKKNTRDLSKSCILGFENTSFKNILVMDGDFQHHPRFILKMFKTYLESDYDFVIGSRDLFNRENLGLSKIRRFFSIFLIFLINLLLGNRTKDPMSGFFIFKKKIFTQNKKKLFSNGYKILSDLIYSSKEKLRIKDVTINFDRRISGKSKMNLSILFILVTFILIRFFKKN
tara:strand:+ start:616 stop:1329 length:714 start_codon:yes stop_codon:yes gene_type:complete